MRRCRRIARHAHGARTFIHGKCLNWAAVCAACQADDSTTRMCKSPALHTCMRNTVMLQAQHGKHEYPDLYATLTPEWLLACLLSGCASAVYMYSASFRSACVQSRSPACSHKRSPADACHLVRVSMPYTRTCSCASRRPKAGLAWKRSWQQCKRCNNVTPPTQHTVFCKAKVLADKQKHLACDSGTYRSTPAV